MLRARTVTFFKQLRVRKDRGKRRAIFSVCGLIRTNARNRLRVRPGPARPGAAPHAHTRAGLRVIRFHVSGNTGIIGPVKFPSSRKFNKTIPEIHEFGGQAIGVGKFFKVFNFPRRPYMSKTVKALRTKIPKEFSVQMGRIL